MCTQPPLDRRLHPFPNTVWGYRSYSKSLWWRPSLVVSLGWPNKECDRTTKWNNCQASSFFFKLKMWRVRFTTLTTLVYLSTHTHYACDTHIYPLAFQSKVFIMAICSPSKMPHACFLLQVELSEVVFVTKVQIGTCRPRYTWFILLSSIAVRLVGPILREVTSKE